MKKILLISTLVIVLMCSMFVLTGCGEEDVTTNNTTSTSTNTNTDTDTTTDVIQVPVDVINAYSEDTVVYELYLSGAGLDSWGDDLLGDQVMNYGEQISLVLNIDAENIQWDMKIVDELGTEAIFSGIDLSNMSTDGGTITLTSDDYGTPYAVAE